MHLNGLDGFFFFLETRAQGQGWAWNIARGYYLSVSRDS